MESPSSPIPFRRYRAPREDGTALIDPDRQAILKQVEDGWNSTSKRELTFCGVAWQPLRESSRSQLLKLAESYTSQYASKSSFLSVDASSQPTRIVMSGHQPELFHPGVWFKNFLLSQIASESNAIGVNVIIDNDLCRQSSVKVPVLQADGSMQIESVSFDLSRETVPWELRTVVSKSHWTEFPAIIRNLLKSESKLIASEIWRFANESLARQPYIGRAFSEARHRIELEYGLTTLEVPLSQLADSAAFALFALEICGDIGSFHNVYNEQLRIYRSAHRIRNHAHPVPELAIDGEWIEAPFWIYSHSHPVRLPLWVRLTDTEIIMSDRQHQEVRFDRRPELLRANATQSFEPNNHPHSLKWQSYVSEGLCIRPRALMTTMYMRMMLSDLFIHGIGGGKYDQLMEAIVASYWQVEIAPKAVATATVQLPAAHNSAQSMDAEIELQSERVQLRRLQYHADELLDANHSELEQLQLEKKRLLENIPPRGEKWRWHREMTRVTQRIKALAADEIESTKRRIEDLQLLSRQQAVEHSREFSFCLFPLDFLTTTLDRLARNANDT